MFFKKYRIRKLQNKIKIQEKKLKLLQTLTTDYCQWFTYHCKLIEMQGRLEYLVKKE